MKHNNCYIYPKTVREAIDGERHYLTGKEKLPSVTTILSGTQDPEKAASLQKWRDRVGEETRQRGSWMSLHLVGQRCIKY